ncbi:MAG: hypothetical protein HY513_01105 [Candidatus Aenigmarchaeota archaeon]|nr:hypothetical protein [Candidatus Aenigmarchaeota archaeon]
MKGQWFLISTVIAVGAFLSISVYFRDYFALDSAEVLRANEEYHFYDIRQQFDNVVAQSDCINLDINLKEFEVFSEKSMAELGYFLYINHKINSCSSGAVKSVTKQMVLASDRAVINEGIDADSVLGIYS